MGSSISKINFFLCLKCQKKVFINDIMYTVSIVTVSHYGRINFLEVLAKCIKKQDYSNIIEWVIVDTSFTGYKITQNDLSDAIKQFQTDKDLPKIIYYKSAKENIGGWRNEASMLVSGDIIVCMDDDDYYPPQRVSHAVEKLADKKTLIAGCDKMYFYDIHFKKFYQFGGFGSTHSTNNCMAYWKEYLINHRYDENVHNAEENSFTNDFKEPMTQLDPEKTVLQFSHDSNTYNKKRIILMNYCMPENVRYIMEKDITPEKFINDTEISDCYNAIFEELSQPQKTTYDIVYYIGLCPPWAPQQTDLGGSEQAVKHLSTEWAKMGKKVAVFGNITWEGNFGGVDYFDYPKFRFWDEFNTLILWRLQGCHPFITFDILAQKLLVDLHDNIPEQYILLANNAKRIGQWMVKSEFHRDIIEGTLGIKVPNMVVIPNGVRTEIFSKPSKESRNPFRMCYCSCYTRGLYRILKGIWPHIYKLEPRAELHVYYGMDLVQDKAFKDEMTLLLSQPGVMDHGRQPVEIINREKHMSTFHFYYTDSPGEIDCISIRESLVAGCIPIISNINMFRYRDGIKIQWLPNLPDYNQQIACAIIEVMHNEKVQNELRNAYFRSSTITTWEQTANEWLKYM